jgi:hypothetical protein
VEQQAKVGDTINATLTITAFGNTGASVTPQEINLDPAKFKIYARPASIDNALTGENLVGQRIESVDLVPISGGTHALPGASITWWNIDTEEVMTTVIQPAVLSVTGPAPSPPKLLEETAIDEAREPQLGGTVETNANRLDWWILALALFALLAVRAIRGLRQHPTSADSPPDLFQPTQDAVNAPQVSLKQALKALDDDQPGSIRRQLMAFLSGHYHQPQRSALQIFQASDPNADVFVRNLSAACFGETELSQAHRQQGRQALMSLKDKANKQTPRSNPSLPALYPD